MAPAHPSRLRSFLSAFFGRDRFEAGMDEELRFHMGAYADDLIRSGVPRTEAIRRARMEFGATDAIKPATSRVRWLHSYARRCAR